MKKVISIISLLCLIVGCVGAKKKIQKRTNKVIDSAFYNSQFTGFLVVNAETKDTLYHFNDKKYFTPASNTKIFTLFTALALLPERIPALKYILKKDTLYIEGTGDPTFLHTYFEHNNTLDFLKRYENISIHLKNNQEEKYGPGWSWEDYGYYYQPEMGTFPMYGNVTTLYNDHNLQIKPSIFKDSVLRINFDSNREKEKNRFYFSATRKDTIEIPFRTSASLTKTLLEDQLQKKISVAPKMPEGKKTVLYSVPVDTVYKRMMHESDNFIADQLLILSSSILSDTLNSAMVRKHILENQLVDLRQPPRWVDGSGLSRYNLFTPESMVAVLSKMYSNIPRKRLFNFFPAGGATGTLRDWYAGNRVPYIYAKSGSLGNNYSLSGYLVTKSGKTLIFSFMNNHFRHPTSEVKEQMEQIFEEIRDSY